MAKKTTPKSNPPAAAKPAAKSAAKPKAAASALPKEAPIVTAPKEPALAPVAVKPAKAAKTAKAAAPKSTEPKPKRTTSKKPVAAAEPGVEEIPAPAAAPVYTQEDVALRAYFISEKRRSQGFPGNEHQDWLEAERQIGAECAAGKKPRKV